MSNHTPDTKTHGSSANREKKAHRRGQFYRPELSTPWQRFTHNLAVRVAAVVLVAGGTAALVVAAVTR
ncbi:hypothetical protein [Subtercola vilae]|uniref:Uncharacterized protein n=1 Tax=Subtercola vilae TaxID=2056433 RepID=A0A4V6U5D1_9MICO|nr:hypothetical protein [Subtercola vilae]TIH35554.1 hypothetical protein D4765_10830 [Subtercola vilae]